MKVWKVLVMVGSMIVDWEMFPNEDHALDWADEMQDKGYKVRIV